MFTFKPRKSLRALCSFPFSAVNTACLLPKKAQVEEIQSL